MHENNENISRECHNQISQPSSGNQTKYVYMYSTYARVLHKSITQLQVRHHLKKQAEISYLDDPGQSLNADHFYIFMFSFVFINIK